MLKQAFFKTIFFLVPIYLLSIAVLAQEKYWLEFNVDHLKEQSQQIELFKDSLKKQYPENLSFHYQSKWNPVVSISTKKHHANSLAKYGFVKKIDPQKGLEVLSVENPTELEYSYALEQIEAHYITDSMKLTGKGVKIGVIDGGFMDADAEPSLQHLIANKQIKFFKDYLLNGNNDPFYGKRISQDDHGTQVLRMIVGSDNGNSIKYGMAENADLYLTRTDHGIREKRIEEDYWVEAIELFHEMGIRLVNSSLGYTDGFDKRKENHSKKEVDGKSSMITRTAQIAAEKGMLIVSAAGNDGHQKWSILSLPSDAQDILTVGAVRFDDWSKLYYSSIGPEKLDYVKPDVACFAANGTSFAAPVITGLAACIWEYDSTLTNLEVIDLIKSSSHLAEIPNNYVGFGVPDSKKVIALLKEEKLKTNFNTVISDQDYLTVDLPAGIETVVIFHKENSRNVLEQKSIKIENGQSTFKIEKIDKAMYSTIVAQNKYQMEIEWK
ncbi:Subtilase family protein [Marivirga sericea]|uniref:Subtilase family protein n=1 Tax=Marivirga sericea TaxID=1028 RepID=A0A1X7HZN2_9BACT|nr:S8 family serine peptidase [Marivirga sericea]SMG07522.1 Subtilase family protein [Marivirga sericea]